MAHLISRILPKTTPFFQPLERALVRTPASTLAQRCLSTVPQSAHNERAREKTFSGKSLVAGGVVGSLVTGLVVHELMQRKVRDEAQKKVDDEVQKYVKFVNEERVGAWGDHTKGQIEMLRDPASIKECMKLFPDRTIGMGIKTPWHVVLNMPVKFPNGKLGTMPKMIPQQHLKGGIVGAVGLPILPDKRILLEVNDRFGPGKEILEVPRGFAEGNEVGVKVVAREVREETRAEITSKPTLLGHYRSDTAFHLGDVPVYSVEVSGFTGKFERDDAEKGTMHLFAMTREELDEAIRRGFVYVKIKDEVREVEAGTDGFLLAALQLYDTHFPKSRPTIRPKDPVRGESAELPMELFKIPENLKNKA